MSGTIGLGEAIRALRAELAQTRQDGDGQWLRFQPGPVELELEVSLSKDLNGKIGWQVLEAGASRESVRSQVVRLTLTPQVWDPGQRRYRTDFLVAGETAAEGTPAEDGAPLPQVDAEPE